MHKYICNYKMWSKYLFFTYLLLNNEAYGYSINLE